MEGRKKEKDISISKEMTQGLRFFWPKSGGPSKGCKCSHVSLEREDQDWTTIPPLLCKSQSQDESEPRSDKPRVGGLTCPFLEPTYVSSNMTAEFWGRSVTYK